MLDHETLDVNEAKVLVYTQVDDEVLHAACQHNLDISIKTVVDGRTRSSAEMGWGPISTRVTPPLILSFDVSVKCVLCQVSQSTRPNSDELCPGVDIGSSATMESPRTPTVGEPNEEDAYGNFSCVWTRPFEGGA